jgi:shikimate dehydrogenase
MIKLYGLIGNPLTHSFSEEYFNQKFKSENLYCRYQLFPIKDVSEFKGLITNHPDLAGLNVTLPFKKQVLNYLDHISAEAKNAGAVNCIRIERKKGKNILFGYNTDIYGFEQSIKPYLKIWHRKALILGTGGSSTAVALVLKSLGIDYLFVSRQPKFKEQIPYGDLTPKLIEYHHIIINATPVGMFPGIDRFPEIPYHCLTPDHLIYDLIYNPAETMFLKKSKEKGAATINGLKMLHLQADKSWEIWQ